ncbi:hypothetical protein ACFQ22_08010 [Lentilactobacillus raoultii]|uniref:ABC-2 type transport system permease protein n=1 Tax=Lentilactobacillus raoultii TaxID=1987503 RepID=A0ABW3PGQ4_9LACO|nr:hypothetical protein [Lentilactobacillus raoultii]
MNTRKLTIELLLINGLNLLYDLANRKPILLGLNYHFKILDLAANLIWLLAVSYVFATFFEQRFLATVPSIVTRYQTRRQLLGKIMKLAVTVAIIQAGSQSGLILITLEAPFRLVWQIFATAGLAWLVILVGFTCLWLEFSSAIAYLSLFIGYVGCLILGDLFISNGQLGGWTTLLTPQLINGYRLMALPAGSQLLISSAEAGLIVGWLLGVIKHYDFLKG